MHPLARALGFALPAFAAVMGLGCKSQPSAIESFATDYCSYFTPCCASSGDAGLPSAASCQNEVTSWQSFGFDPSLTAACLAAMKQAATTTDFCTTLGAAQAPCDAVFAAVASSGSVQPGGTCTSTEDCASPSGAVAVCLPVTANASTGTCRQVLRGLAGDTPCSSDDFNGGTATVGSGPLPNVSYACHDFDGVFCDFTSKTCEPFLAVGAQGCDPNADSCGPSAFCMSAGNSADGGVLEQCTAGLAAGATCDPSAATDGTLPCDPATTKCSAATKTCTPFLSNGTPCTTDDQCQGSCLEGKCASVLEAELCDTTVGQPFHPASAPVTPFVTAHRRAKR